MAYAIKYLFKFESSNGTTREIRVLQDGYTGEVVQRPLGRAPVLKKQQNGPVHGTSLEFYAECNVDREFIEFYTSDPKAYRVDLYAGATLLWRGYITPELYSEPDIAPPYDVRVVATDGVGELKLYDYAAQGTVTLRTLLSGLLSRTGLGTDIYLISSLKAGSRGAGALLDMTINLDYMAGESCYDVLTYLLDTLHATITWWKGAWILTRETNVTFTSGKVRYFNTAGNSALLADSVQTLGSLRANPAWPVGQLSTVIDPAKNRVTVQAPWHVVTCLRNSDMGSDADWTKAKNARYETDGYVLPININTGTSETAVISQATSMAGLRVPMNLSVKATGATSEISAQVTGAVLGVLLTYKVGNVTYHLVKGDDGVPVWQQGDDIGTYIPLRTRVDFQQQLATWDSSRIEAEELTIDNIPPFLQGTTFPAGTLTVYILGYCAKIYGAYLDVVLPKGYQDILRIDNGARGEGSEVEIAIGRETTDNAYYAAFLQGLLLDSGNLITSFSDANFPGGMDYLAFIARDYALSVALPRAKVTGTVYLESGIAAPPLVFTKGALNYWLQTWSWNLYEDELEIEGLTLPSASLTVESETILESNGSTVSSAGSAGSSSAGSSMGGGVGTNYWEIDGTLNTLLKPKDAYAYVHSKDGLFFTGAALSGTVVPDLYVDTVNNQRVLRSPLPLITGGDQIVIDGTPGGGGGGGGATTLAGLDDTNITNPQAGQMLAWNGSKWVNTNAPTGSITSVSLAAGASNGTLHLVVNGTDQSEVAVTGLKALAYKDSLAFSEITGAASASQIPTLAISKISGLQTALDGKQPLDADLTAIAGLTGTSGFLKKTAANTWSLDTNTYLTGITSTMVTNALGYTPADNAALANYLPLTGGTLTSPSGARPLRLNSTKSNASGIVFAYNNTEFAGIVSYTNEGYLRRTSGSWAEEYIIWDAGNDGASSGLDADLLDGQHGSYYAPVSALDNYLPLTAGTSKPLTDSLYIITGDTDKAIQFSYNSNHLAGASWRIISEGTGSLDTNYLSFQTGGSAATATTWNNVLRLSMDNRYVGINLDAPAYQLDVNGTARVTSLKIGSATITWNSNGYLHIDQPLVTAGDQIVISGTPGGGGGGGATNLWGLDDVSVPHGTTTPSDGQVLTWDASLAKWTNKSITSGVSSVVGQTGAVTTAQIATALTGAGYKLTDTTYSAGTGISLSGTTFSLDAAGAKTALGLGSNAYTSTAYLPLAGEAMNATAVISRTGQSVSWYQGRLYPIIKTTSYTGYNAILSMKTTNGSWDLGVYNSDTAYLTYITDENYSAGNNAVTYQLTFPKASGTVALTSQIPTNNNQLTNGAGYLTATTAASTYVKFDPGASEQTIKSSISTFVKGVINLWRSTGDHYTFLGFSNGTTETYLGGIGFKSQSDHNLYRKDGGNYYKILDENNYTSYVNTTNFPGLNKTGTVTSVAMTVPTGLSVSGTPITTSGTLAISFEAGYSIPTTAKQSNWDTAYGWGNHASAGYLLASTAASTYLPLTGGIIRSASSYARLRFVTDATAAYIQAATSDANSGNLYLSALDGGVGSNLYLKFSSIYATDANYTVYHSGNANLSTVDWDCKALTASGNIQASGNVYCGAIFDLNRDSSSDAIKDSTKMGMEIEATASYIAFKPYTSSGAAWGTILSLSSSGNVGIGTTSPAYKLDVNGATRISGVLTATAFNAPNYLYSANVASAGWYRVAKINTVSRGASVMMTLCHGFNYNQTQSFTFSISIGYNSADIVQLSGDVANKITKVRVVYESANVCYIDFYTNTTNSDTYWVSGTIIGAGAFSAPAAESLTSFTASFSLDVIAKGMSILGTIHSTGDQVVSSDRTLKTNFKDVTYSVADIAKAPAVTFDWKDGRGRSAGSIAQYWKDILPELVHGEEGNMSLAYGQLALVNTILLARQSESLVEQIERLEARVAELEAEVKRLRMN